MALSRARYLADKSALARVHLDPVAQRVGPLYLAGEVATCGVVDLELLFSARSCRDYLDILSDRRSLPRAEVGEAQLERAVEVQTALARQSRHRGVSIPDLLIAAAAESAGLTVLHYHQDFDLVAEVTGQRCEWVVARGSVT
ncbi:MAG TPA: PIN domain nuclease [Candidatus Dormibacteraeota bacterium]|nr:PIN domain nuclease [Candidatus Dormibacteraeota bacterium]